MARGFSAIQNNSIETRFGGADAARMRADAAELVAPIVAKKDLEKATLDAIAEMSQQANGALRIKMHDKHAALVSLGKHLGLFTHSVQIKAVYGIRDKPMTA